MISDRPRPKDKHRENDSQSDVLCAPKRRSNTKNTAFYLTLSHFNHAYLSFSTFSLSRTAFFTA